MTSQRTKKSLNDLDLYSQNQRRDTSRYSWQPNRKSKGKTAHNQDFIKKNANAATELETEDTRKPELSETTNSSESESATSAWMKKYSNSRSTDETSTSYKLGKSESSTKKQKPVNASKTSSDTTQLNDDCPYDLEVRKGIQFEPFVLPKISDFKIEQNKNEKDQTSLSNSLSDEATTLILQEEIKGQEILIKQLTNDLNFYKNQYKLALTKFDGLSSLNTLSLAQEVEDLKHALENNKIDVERVLNGNENQIKQYIAKNWKSEISQLSTSLNFLKITVEQLDRNIQKNADTAKDIKQIEMDNKYCIQELETKFKDNILSISNHSMSIDKHVSEFVKWFDPKKLDNISLANVKSFEKVKDSINNQNDKIDGISQTSSDIQKRIDASESSIEILQKQIQAIANKQELKDYIQTLSIQTNSLVSQGGSLPKETLKFDTETAKKAVYFAEELTKDVKNLAAIVSGLENGKKVNFQEENEKELKVQEENDTSLEIEQSDIQSIRPPSLSSPYKVYIRDCNPDLKYPINDYVKSLLGEFGPDAFSGIKRTRTKNLILHVNSYDVYTTRYKWVSKMRSDFTVIDSPGLTRLVIKKLSSRLTPDQLKKTLEIYHQIKLPREPTISAKDVDGIINLVVYFESAEDAKKAKSENFCLGYTVYKYVKYHGKPKSRSTKEIETTGKKA